MGRRGWWALGLIAVGEVVLATGVGPVLTAPARRLLLWAWVPLVLWLTEAVPLGVAALLIPVGGVMLGLASEREAFGPFADPVIFLFLGSFLVARALEKHGAAAWMARRVVAIRFLAGSPHRMTLGIGLAAFGLSMWLSNTATAATLLPVVVALGQHLPDGAARQQFYKPALLLVAYGASIGGTATPVGTPPNLIALGLLARLAPEVPRPSFAAWVGMAFPIALTLFLLVHAWLYVRWLRHVPWQEVRLGPTEALSVAGRRTVGAFVVLVVLWFLPGILQWVLPTAHPLREFLASRWPESIPPVVIAVLLFLIPAGPGRTALLERSDLLRIDWDTLLLFGGGLSLGTLFHRTGLLNQVVHALTGPVVWTWGMALLASTALGIFLTDLMSNTAYANFLIPFVITLGQTFHLPVGPLVIGKTLGTSMAFLLPVSTPPNAIVFGTGHLRLRDMVGSGIVADFLSLLLITGGIALMHRWGWMGL